MIFYKVGIHRKYVGLPGKIKKAEFTFINIRLIKLVFFFGANSGITVVGLPMGIM